METSKTNDIFAATHQLKNPLTRNKWLLNLLLNDELGSFSPAQRELLERINLNNERTIGLIKEMLRADREEKSVYEFKPVQIDIGELIKKVITEVTPDASRKNVSFKINKAKENVPMVFADEDKIHYLFENLLENSIQYTKDGDVVIINIDDKDNNLYISIKDNGIGIPADDQVNIFKKFFRAQNASKIEKDGTGLGLFMASHIIEEHKGKIWFESEENKGTTFWVTIPISEGV